MEILSIIVAGVSLLVSIIAMMKSSRMAAIQNEISKRQYTLNYIEMENNDEQLNKARNWVHDIEKSGEYIASFSSKENFFEYHNVDCTSLYQDVDLIHEYMDGLNYINKVIATRQIAAEAVISGMLDEETYWLVRNSDFSQDYRKLKQFMFDQYKIKEYSKSYDRKAFRLVVKKWQKSIINNIESNMNKNEWNQYYEDFESDSKNI